VACSPAAYNLRMQVLGVIPARYGATRFPGKPLADIGGRSLVRHVWERACKCTTLSRVVVATEDERVAEHVCGFGGEPVITSPDHASGTDRLGEVASREQFDYYVNIQGDEPLLATEAVDALVSATVAVQAPMSTLVTPLFDDFDNPNVVKVVRDAESFALYFSRSRIPYPRNDGGDYLKHIGIYMYSRDTLLSLCKLPMAMAERSESLEQLRALHNGIRIFTVDCDYDSIAVDVPDDVAKVLERLAVAG
jgi:3-deoxy-manno-octulosonate cytidylyltransferase (CMP-KDO synthetase)